jgi:hypothetical protein
MKVKKGGIESGSLEWLMSNYLIESKMVTIGGLWRFF